MVMMSHGTDSKWVNEEYHLQRIKALRTIATIDNVGEVEKERYDLDKLPGELGGEMYQPGYIVRRDLVGEVEEDRFDLREIPGHR